MSSPRCRKASYSTMAALTEALSDAIGPDMGMEIAKSHSFMLRRDTPRSSEPITSAVGGDRSASRKSVFALASSATVCKPRFLRCDSVLDMFGTRATCTCTNAPADARIARVIPTLNGVLG